MRPHCEHLGDYIVLNADIRPANFIVTRSGEKEYTTGFRVVTVDFGLSRLPREEESEFDWGRAKWDEDEEGTIGMVMQHMLRRLGKEIEFDHSDASQMHYWDYGEGESENEGRVACNDKPAVKEKGQPATDVQPAAEKDGQPVIDVDHQPGEEGEAQPSGFCRPQEED